VIAHGPLTAKGRAFQQRALQDQAGLTDQETRRIIEDVRGTLDTPAEQPNDRSRGWIAVVAIAGSAGGIEAMRQILARLPADFPAPILYVQHLNGSCYSALADVLQWHTVLKVRWAQQNDRIMPGVVYLGPPGCFLLVDPQGALALAPTATHRDVLRGADRLFTSVAGSFADRSVAVVLSGAGWDGSDGVHAVRAHHGTVLVQDETSASQRSMPQAAIATGCADLVLPLKDIAPVLVNLVRDAYPLAALQASTTRLAEGRRIPISPALQDGLDRLLVMALRMHGTDLGNIQLVEPTTGDLAIVAQRGFGLDFLEHFRRVRWQDGSACSRALRTREPVLIPDVTSDPLFAMHRDIAASAGFRAVQSTPIINRNGTLLGVLSTHFRSPYRPPQTEPHRLDRLVARQASHLVERLCT
jgi:hypothetical protein